MSDIEKLLTEVQARYGSVDAFCARLHALVEDPTIELPVVDPSSTTSAPGRHRRIDEHPEAA
ncbi:hypothetical protein [Nocardia jejuensis]|uniref:hypothetical protein n=1 Tax=Nocardia jejuensis TaxID=328049 RepID=UPI00082E4BF5|nr:hypothetical protein [Nocardia jejuensis]